MDVVALGELLIDFACVSVDEDGYPTMAAHPAPPETAQCPGTINFMEVIL